ncbi:MAG: DUF5916 domain-containing protein [Vicinamibacterales bacterium]
MTRPGRLAIAVAVLCLSASTAAAQEPGADGGGAGRPGAGSTGGGIDGPPAPVAPATISRDDAGHATVRAIRLLAPLDVDGQLDEPVYADNPPFGDLIQVVPATGQPATEKTELWLMFDDRNIYVGARVHESAPPEAWVANEYRRDSSPLRQNDHVGVGFDTFYDRRSGFMFYASPLGAFSDYSTIDEGQPNSDWNPVWNVRTGRFAGGWTMEMIIPFKSLRFTGGRNQTWGFQVRRSIRRKNEWAYLTGLPASMAGPQGLNRVSLYGSATGIDAPPAGRTFEIKPYVFGRSTTDRLRLPPISNDLDAQVGLDVKYGITANLVADFTYNTDFAQVEVDEQQLNLTRFSLFFPEKRDFFLEGRGIFDFGRGGATGFGGGSGGLGSGFNQQSATPFLFYSRRIGLNNGRIVPIQVGGRVTGKVGKFGVGLLNIQSDAEAVSATPSTNFSVVRVKRDILRKSTVGAMFTSRSASNVAPGSGNQVFGVDGAFGFYENLTIGGYYARTWTDGLSGDDDSFQGRFDYFADRYGARFEYLDVGDDFNPEIGFLQRDNFRRSFASLRFSPRPRRLKGVRKLTWQADLEHLENGAGALETRVQVGRFNVELENSDTVNLEVTRDYEMIQRPFPVAGGPTIAPGSYSFDDVQVSYSLGAQRRIAGTVTVQAGDFWNGTIRTLSYTAARVSLLKQFSIEPTVQRTRIALPQGAFTTTLVRTRADYAFSPRMFASALVQYNSIDRSFSSNIRYRWEYKLGSEFFVVYTDERDTTARGYPGLKNRAFVVKVTRFFRL